MVNTGDRRIGIPDESTTPLLPAACSKEADRPARVLKVAGAATAVTIGEEAAGSSCSASCCRICLEDATTLEDPLISPCLCTGSTGLVHRRCLSRWRANKAGSPAYFRCEICHYKYHFRRLWWGGVLRDKATLATVVLLLVPILGFCPIIQAILGIPPSADFKLIRHLANGLIIFVLIGSMGMLVSVCCCCSVPTPAAGHPDPNCESCVSGGSCGVCEPDPCGSCRSCNPDPDLCWLCSIAGGCGGDCDGLRLLPRAWCLVCVLAPVGGPLVAYAAYARWYTWVSWVLHTLEVLVENVGPVARKWAMARAARKGSKEVGGGAKAAAVVAEGADAGAGSEGEVGASGAEAGAATQAPATACMV